MDYLVLLWKKFLHLLQVCGLRELARLALVGDAIASQLATPELLNALLVRTGKVVGTLCRCSCADHLLLLV